MQEVVIATMTWVRSEQEAELVEGGLSSLSGQGLRVVAADGGSPPEAVTRLRGIPGLTLAPFTPGEGPCLLGQVRASLAAAAELGSRWILYAEPDKRDFFRTGVTDFLREARARFPEAGLVLPARDDASFATFPPGQQLTERLFNELAAAYLESPGDYLYGPMLLRRELAAELEELREDVGWGWRTYLMARCVRRGLPLRLSERYLPCPDSQRDEDDLDSRRYRMEQMAQGIRGLSLGLA